MDTLARKDMQDHKVTQVVREIPVMWAVLVQMAIPVVKEIKVILVVPE